MNTSRISWQISSLRNASQAYSKQALYSIIGAHTHEISKLDEEAQQFPDQEDESPVRFDAACEERVESNTVIELALARLNDCFGE